MKKQSIIILIIILAVILVLAYIFRCKVFKIGCVIDPNKTDDPLPTGAVVWVKETFPLNVGMYGNNTKILQSKLGISADGKFGDKTKAAIENKGYSVPLSKIHFDNIINPIIQGGGTNFQKLRATLAGGSKNFSQGIQYPILGTNNSYMFDFYTSGQFVLHKLASTKVILKGEYSDGGNIFKLENGKIFNGTPYTNMQATLEYIKDWLI